MAHECLKRTCIDPAASQGIPGSVAQHVSVDREWQISGHAEPFNQLLGAVDGKGRLALWDRGTPSGIDLPNLAAALDVAIQSLIEHFRLLLKQGERIAPALTMQWFLATKAGRLTSV
jgi:hypothetical protein